MSQHSLRPLDPAIERVLVGWDPRLQTFYARVVPGEDAPPSTPGLWIGNEPREILDPAALLAVVADYAVVPDGLAARLHADRGGTAQEHPSVFDLATEPGPEPSSEPTAVSARPPGTSPGADQHRRSNSVGRGGDPADEHGVPYEVFGQVELARQIAAAGGFDVSSGVQMAREYTNVLEQLDEVGEPGAVPRFDVYDVAAVVTEFDWVQASRGETLPQARERATRVGADLILHADTLDATREPEHVARAYRHGLRWVQRSRPLHVAVRDAVASDMMPAPFVLRVVQSIPRGEMLLPQDNPALTAAVLTAVLAVQSPPERTLAARLARVQQRIHAIESGRTQPPTPWGGVPAGGGHEGGRREDARAGLAELRAQARAHAAQAQQVLDEPVRLHPPLADPLRAQRAALPVPRITAVEVAWIAAVGRARSNLADMIGPDPVTAAEARADILHDWPRHTHRLLAEKSAAQRASRPPSPPKAEPGGRRPGPGLDRSNQQRPRGASPRHDPRPEHGPGLG